MKWNKLGNIAAHAVLVGLTDNGKGSKRGKPPRGQSVSQATCMIRSTDFRTPRL